MSRPVHCVHHVHSVHCSTRELLDRSERPTFRGWEAGFGNSRRFGKTVHSSRFTVLSAQFKVTNACRIRLSFDEAARMPMRPPWRQGVP
jgi:hypothetical protein